LHNDETGINIKGKLRWLHSASNEKWTLFFPHDKRGTEAMEAMGILPHFKGIAVHDHWKPYLGFDCEHVLCNAHRAPEQAWNKWGESPLTRRVHHPRSKRAQTGLGAGRPSMGKEHEAASMGFPLAWTLR
jgi:hypothetical protein